MGFDLDYIFHPRNIAVAGASESPEKTGHTYFKTQLENFKGKVYPINFRAKEVLGVPTYQTVKDLPEDVDYVISAIPNTNIIDLVRDCISKNVKILHLYTARFSETGYEKEAALEREMLEMARSSGLRILGPNCMGLYYPREGISFGRGFPEEPGTVGFISQSGGNASEVISSGAIRGLRFSKVISYGNAIDLNEAILIDYLAEDPETKVIGAYIEGVRDGPAFVKAVKRASQIKPVVLLKGGRTQAGTHMVSSHTASLAGAQEVWKAMCRQTGAINAFSMDEMLDMLVAFSCMPKATGFRLLVGGGSGGKSVLSADECEEEGLELQTIPDDVREELTRRDEFFGAWVTNPVDSSIMGGSNLTPHEVIDLIGRSPAYDVVINSISAGGPLATTDPNRQSRATRILDHTADIANDLGKPVALVIADVAPETEQQLQAILELRHRCIEGGFATFPSMNRASRAVRRLVDYYRWISEIE